MDNDKKLQELFENDPLGLLNVKPSTTPARNEEERLLASFQEINQFYENNNREPQQGGGILEHQLYSRLTALRADQSKMEMLKPHDRFDLLHYELKEYNSLDDVLNDDALGLLDDDSEGLFDLTNVKKQDERAMADFVAHRKPCKNFSKYEPVFQEVQNDLANKKRKLIEFKQDHLRAGDFYVHNGILLFLEKVDYEKQILTYKSGSRVRKDGRTKVIFENGTESNMLYRSLYKSLLANGKAVSENVDKINEGFLEKFSNIDEQDTETGYIYILKSKSNKPEIREIKNLFKIGYSKIRVEDRIKNANQEPTYLMADVRIVIAYKCYNINPQKLEQLLHNFFGSYCLNIDVFDNEGNRHTPREWFIAPLNIIEQAVHFILSGEIIGHKYDGENEQILSR